MTTLYASILLPFFIFHFLLTTGPGGNQATASRQFSKFNTDCLQAHNKFRTLHGAPPLHLDHELIQSASKSAKFCLKSKRMVPSKANKSGENIYSRWLRRKAKSGFQCENAVKAWYMEELKYNYNTAAYSKAVGHFTQLVWKESTNLGCALESEGRWLFIVCHYSPSGNIAGRFKSNVHPTIKR